MAEHVLLQHPTCCAQCNCDTTKYDKDTLPRSLHVCGRSSQVKKSTCSFIIDLVMIFLSSLIFVIPVFILIECGKRYKTVRVDECTPAT